MGIGESNMKYADREIKQGLKKVARTSLVMVIGCLSGFFIVLVSCIQNPSLDDLAVYSSDSDSDSEYAFKQDILVGSPSYSAQLTPPRPFAAPKDDYEHFFNYRLENFAPSTEPLMEARFGNRLGIKQDSLWEYNSYASCAVGFSSSLPSISVIEYGETAAYGSRTDASESYFYNHLHCLKNLKEGTTYHYRVVIQDRNDVAIALPDRTFVTKTFTDEVVKLYQSDFTHTAENGIVGSGLQIVGAGVGQIDSPSVYVLMEDVATDGLGVNIKKHNVTIDLNGHTLTYDNGNNPLNDDDQYNESGSWGIRAGLWNFLNIKIYNGSIKQGKTGSSGKTPLFLYHMGGATQNEIAGLTIDYHGPQTSGIYSGHGYIHHNLIYDRGSVVTDRHAAVRALDVGGGSAGAEVAYNSFRRFRQRGVDNAASVHDNELYSDSFDTNSFALGVGDNAVVKNNKVFGMGYHPIGIGWGSNIHVADNFIYLWAYAPTQRSAEYARKSSVAGMRVTNYGGTNFENMLFEGNVIVLKATDHATMARGIWTTNGADDRNILYRHNIVKVEAMPGNFTADVPWNGDIYYNGDVNNAISAVSVQGNGWTSEEIPSALIFEDNRFISNVNHILLGEGYGIGSGVRFYRSTLEKIDHDSDRFFAPVRLGFWYWNTLGNRMIDTKLVGVSEEEMTPHFYGGAGKMEMFYGERKAFRFTDGNGRALANTSITLTTAEGDCRQTQQTDREGKALFDLVSVRHFKYGNSLENGGIPGTPDRTYYQQYVFSAEGYRSYAISAAEGKTATSIMLER
jgi:hypothetical protein